MTTGWACLYCAAMTHTQWLAALKKYRREQGWTQAELGRRAAKVLRRKKPYTEGAISRFLSGTTNSPELVSAFSDIMGIAPPAASLEDPNLQQWLEAGAALQRLAPVLFGQVLERVERFVSQGDPKKLVP